MTKSTSRRKFQERYSVGARVEVLSWLKGAAVWRGGTVTRADGGFRPWLLVMVDGGSEREVRRASDVRPHA